MYRLKASADEYALQNVALYIRVWGWNDLISILWKSWDSGELTCYEGQISVFLFLIKQTLSISHVKIWYVHHFNTGMILLPQFQKIIVQVLAINWILIIVFTFIQGLLLSSCICFSSGLSIKLTEVARKQYLRKKMCTKVYSWTVYWYRMISQWISTLILWCNAGPDFGCGEGGEGYIAKTN